MPGAAGRGFDKPSLNSNRQRKEFAMKQTIILLATVILGIAISVMILSFEETTKTITDATKDRMASVLEVDETS